tara:strand:+ start:50 stop:613 length:564 start_codon:yes stop_codon:yes gene_type:complete
MRRRRRRRRRKSLDAIFSYLFDTQKPTKKKIEESVVLNRPLVLGLSPCLSFFFTRFVSEKKVFTFNARNTTTTMAVTVNAIMKKSAPAPARTVKRNVRFFIIKYILLSFYLAMMLMMSLFLFAGHQEDGPGEEADAGEEAEGGQEDGPGEEVGDGQEDGQESPRAEQSGLVRGVGKVVRYVQKPCFS